MDGLHKHTQIATLSDGSTERSEKNTQLITHIESIRDWEADNAGSEMISTDDCKQSRKQYQSVADELKSHRQPAETHNIQPSAPINTKQWSKWLYLVVRDRDLLGME